MNVKSLASAFLISGLVSCGGGSGGGGGGSGLPSNTPISDLSDAEVMDLCEYLAGLQGDERTVDCGDGTTITTGIDPAELDAEIADCVASAPSGECPITVGQTENCLEAIAGFSDDELCDFFMSQSPPAACEPLFDPPASCGAEDDAPPPPPGP